MLMRDGRSGASLFVVILSAALLLTFEVRGFAQAPETDASTEGAPMAGAETFDVSPDFFPIFPWSRLSSFPGDTVTREEAVAGIAECNFTVAGFVLPEDLPLCEKYGLKAIMHPGIIDRGKVKEQSDAEVEAAAKEAIERAGDSGAILGYHLMDEPGASLFPKLGVAVAAVKKYAPGKLAFINLFPGYATIGAPDQSQLETPSYREYLERFVEEVQPQVISYDDYMVQYSMDLENQKHTAQYFSDLLEVRDVAIEHGLPFWNVVSSNQIRPHTTIPSPANLQLQAYTTLAAGGKGLVWYTYCHGGYAYRPIDENGNRTMVWQYLQMVNRQVKTLGPIMNSLRSTGVYFTDPPPLEGAPVLPGELVQTVETDVPLMIGEFEAEDGARYVMPVNLSLERSAKIALQFADGVDEATVISAENGAELGIEEGNAWWLVAGQGALIRLR